MDAYCYCPQCGENEKFDESDIRLDVERHCGKCNTIMITHCPNSECPQYIIETLDRDFCPCGTKYLNIEIARQKYKNDHTYKPRRPRPKGIDLSGF